MHHPFLDNNQPINGGINRTRLVALPGRDLPPDLLGFSGYELLGAAPLQELICRRLPALSGQGDPLPLLNRQLTTPDLVPAAAAASVAEEIGVRLGCLLLALQAGARGPRGPREDWGEAHWAFWEQVRRIWLGGGVATGRLGALIAAAATDFLQRSGLTGFQITPAQHGARLPLLGAARLLPGAAGCYPVVDCGQTRIKAGLATIGNGAVTALEPLADESGPCTDLWLRERDPDMAQALWDRLLAQLGAILMAHAPGAGPLAAVVALACRIHQGHPLPREWMSCYGRLQLICDHLESALAMALSSACGMPVTLRLVQDATAAALPYAGHQNGVVLTLGTAIGTGYVPANAAGLLPLSLAR